MVNIQKILFMFVILFIKKLTMILIGDQIFFNKGDLLGIMDAQGVDCLTREQIEALSNANVTLAPNTFTCGAYTISELTGVDQGPFDEYESTVILTNDLHFKVGAIRPTGLALFDNPVKVGSTYTGKGFEFTMLIESKEPGGYMVSRLDDEFKLKTISAGLYFEMQTEENE